ncbi:unnamed protein product [Merluccius merluccius]
MRVAGNEVTSCGDGARKGVKLRRLNVGGVKRRRGRGSTFDPAHTEPLPDLWSAVRCTWRKTYSSVPNAQTTCKQCTSCTEPWVTDVDIKPHVEEIATVVTWWNIRDVARESGFTRDDINSLRLNHPDFTERTPLLLHQWVEKMEKMGNNAARELLEKLTDLRRFYDHDRVFSILYMRKPAETQP